MPTLLGFLGPTNFLLPTQESFCCNPRTPLHCCWGIWLLLPYYRSNLCVLKRTFTCFNFYELLAVDFTTGSLVGYLDLGLRFRAVGCWTVYQRFRKPTRTSWKLVVPRLPQVCHTPDAFGSARERTRRLLGNNPEGVAFLPVVTGYPPRNCW
jgi:hypothetical protein